MSLLGQIIEFVKDPSAAAQKQAEAGLVAYAEAVYRAARPEMSPDALAAAVKAGLETVRVAHADFASFAPEMVRLQAVIFANLTVLAPAEWFETLFVIARHAGFAQPCRDRAAQRTAADRYLEQAQAGPWTN